MKPSAIHGLVGGCFILVFLLTFITMLVTLEVQAAHPPPPSQQIWWKCPPDPQTTCANNRDSCCVMINANEPGAYVRKTDCDAHCTSTILGSCVWSSETGYTGKCSTSTTGVDNVPLSAANACTHSGQSNAECLARKKNQLQKCGPHGSPVTYCSHNSGDCCVANQTDCVELNCCNGQKVELRSYAKACVPLRSCTPVGKPPPTCTLPSSSTLPYYYCSSTGGTCLMVQSELPPDLTGAATNPHDGCKNCPSNVWWKKETTTVDGNTVNWCNYVLGLPPDPSWTNSPSYCSEKKLPVPDSGWCWQPPTDVKNSSCGTIDPDPAACLGSPVPVIKTLVGCPNGSNVEGCTSKMTPKASPWDVANCCAYGALSKDGKGKTSPFGQCLPTEPGCACLNPSMPESSWDGKTYPSCVSCSNDISSSSPLLRQCLDPTNAEGTHTGSICKNNQCMCRFPDQQSCSKTDWWKISCGDNPCESVGCVGCTAESKKSPLPLQCAGNFIQINFGSNFCKAVQNDVKEDKIYVCHDGSPCNIGNTDAQLDAILSGMKLSTSCLANIRNSFRYCANNSGSCKLLSDVLPNNSTTNSRCVVYNSLDVQDPGQLESCLQNLCLGYHCQSGAKTFEEAFQTYIK